MDWQQQQLLVSSGQHKYDAIHKYRTRTILIFVKTNEKGRIFVENCNLINIYKTFQILAIIHPFASSIVIFARYVHTSITHVKHRTYWIMYIYNTHVLTDLKILRPIWYVFFVSHVASKWNFSWDRCSVIRCQLMKFFATEIGE